LLFSDWKNAAVHQVRAECKQADSKLTTLVFLDAKTFQKFFFAEPLPVLGQL
jgi:hypothetical protein